MEQAAYILDEIKIYFDRGVLNKNLRIRTSKAEALVAELVEQAAEIARPKAAIMLSGLDLAKNSEEDLSLEGVPFSSGLLYRKLTGLGRVFPYVATEGRELAQWGEGLDGMRKIFANSIQNYALDHAQKTAEKFIVEKFGLSQVSAMNPGSLMEWPINQQKALFKLMGRLPEKIGVELLASYMMTPEQSVSGIFFQSDAKFHNCQLCPKSGCHSRLVPYSGEE